MKFIYFNQESQYSDYILYDLKNRQDIIWYSKPINKRIKKIRDLHTSIKANSYFKLPFKSIWYKTLTSEKISDNEKYICIFEEGNKFSYDFTYIRYLRNYNQNIKFVFCFANPADYIPVKIRKQIELYYDLIITFNKNDSDLYGYTHYSGIYSKIDIKMDTEIPSSDVFFIGHNKGRFHKIMDVYHHLTSIGLKCEFYISEVPKNEIIEFPGVHYNQYMAYEEVIKHVMNTRSVLEVLQRNQNGSSLRTMEAIVYEKKLITNNVSISKERFYNPEQMLVYRDIKDINISFFNDMGMIKYNGSVSPNLFLEFLKTKFKDQDHGLINDKHTK